MANEIKYQLNALLRENAVTKDDKDDKILEVQNTGTADQERIISEIMAMNPGLEPEAVRMVLDLENRALSRLILTGMRVNTGLFLAEARCRGTVQGNAWDPERNSIYVNFTQGKDLREAIEATTVKVTGEKGATMYVTGGSDLATRVPGYTATAGRAYTLTGAKLKVAGTDPAVGIVFIDADGTETPVPQDLWVVNNPSRLTFIIPAGLADGTYTLRVTTQFSGSSTLLKSPRSIEQTLVVGEATDAPVNPGGSGGGSGDDDDDFQLG